MTNATIKPFIFASIPVTSATVLDVIEVFKDYGYTVANGSLTQYDKIVQDAQHVELNDQGVLYVYRTSMNTAFYKEYSVYEAMEALERQRKLIEDAEYVALLDEIERSIAPPTAMVLPFRGTGATDDSLVWWRKAITASKVWVVAVVKKLFNR